MSLAFYEDRFARLNVRGVGKRESPQKPAMLLAVLDLFAQRTMRENRITFSPELLELFAEYFEAVRGEGDRATPIHPFFYLREEKFWQHRARTGQEAALIALKGPPGVKGFLAIADYVFLDDELFLLLHHRDNRAALREVLITRYFSAWRTKVAAIAEKESRIAAYQRWLDEGEGTGESPKVPEFVRETAFSRIVRRAYDYRCAACGLRVVLEGGLYIVDAAHLIPFAESHDDDPRNGIALCKNHYWAMEQNLIAPGTDRAWHVLKPLDDRLEGQRELIPLDGRTLLLPQERRYHPKEEGLRWRERGLEGDGRNGKWKMEDGKSRIEAGGG
jgi:putative restriction endonuclease